MWCSGWDFGHSKTFVSRKKILYPDRSFCIPKKVVCIPQKVFCIPKSPKKFFVSQKKFFCIQNFFVSQKKVLCIPKKVLCFPKKVFVSQKKLFVSQNKPHLRGTYPKKSIVYTQKKWHLMTRLITIKKTASDNRAEYTETHEIHYVLKKHMFVLHSVESLQKMNVNCASWWFSSCGDQSRSLLIDTYRPSLLSC